LANESNQEKSQEHIGFVIHDLARAFTNTYTKLVEPLGLTKAQARAIAYLARSPGVSQTELAALLGIGTMAAAKLLDRMECKGLVERRPDPDDRRVRRVYLTEHSETVRSDIAPQVEILTTVLTVGFSDQDLANFRSQLLRMEKNLRDLSAALEEKRAHGSAT
jgi:DNA-binding MarR family transcriptional regulator